MNSEDDDRDIMVDHHTGMARADAIIKKAGGFERWLESKSDSPKLENKKSRRRPRVTVDYVNDLGHLENIGGIVLKPFNHLGTGERPGVREYTRRLSELKLAGYPVAKKFREGGRSAVVSRYENARSEMEGLLAQHPQIRARIDERNRRLQSPYS